MSRERLGTHSQGATSRLVFLSYEYTKNDKRTGSNDCVQASLTQSESMLMALCSLHSWRDAPQDCASKHVDHAPKAPEKQFPPCELAQSAVLRQRHMYATTASVRTERRDGLAWECKSGQTRSRGERVLPARNGNCACRHTALSVRTLERVAL